MYVSIATLSLACTPPCTDAVMLSMSVEKVKQKYTKKDKELAQKYKDLYKTIDEVFELQKDTNVLLEESLQLNSLSIIARNKMNIYIKSQLRMIGDK